MAPLRPTAFSPLPLLGRIAGIALVASVAFDPSVARADEPRPLVTWGATLPHGAFDDSPVARARELLLRARALDDAASADERTATEIEGHLAALRTASKAAREKAIRVPADLALVARAEDLEADVVVSEAEIDARRKAAVENRRVARDLRARAMTLAKRGGTEDAAKCEPPFRFTADGRKVYHLDCF